MKTIFSIMILVMSISLRAQTKKTLVATYKRTTEIQGMEGACLYEITFKDEKGSPLVLTDLFHGQVNDALIKMFCDNRPLSESEIEKMNQDGRADKTVKTSVGKKYKITYEILQGDFQCWSLEAGRIS